MTVRAHPPRKRFGQHFLRDAAVIEALYAAIAPSAQDIMVEIGPGLGALTQVLLRNLPRLTVVELDRDLVAQLRGNARLDVVAADVLTVDFSALAQSLAAPCLRVVGNLPYNISSPILFHLLKHVATVQDQHFMLQKELVDRMVARPATAAYGRLSVMLQWRYDMQALFDVGPQAFSPPPRVDSAVVRMLPKVTWGRVNDALYAELVRVAFSQRRKLLRHTLGAWLDKRACACRFDLGRRAEEVPVAEYVALAQALGDAQA